MNSKIFELGKIIKIFPPDFIPNDSLLSENVMMRLGELVVRECILVVNGMMVHNNQEQVRIVDVDTKLKQHFGIKE